MEFITITTNIFVLILMPISFYLMLKQVRSEVDEIALDNKHLKSIMRDIESTLSFRSRVETFQSRDNWEQCLEQEKRINEKIKESHKSCVQKKCSHQCKKHCEDK